MLAQLFLQKVISSLNYFAKSYVSPLNLAKQIKDKKERDRAKTNERFTIQSLAKFQLWKLFVLEDFLKICLRQILGSPEPESS